MTARLRNVVALLIVAASAAAGASMLAGSAIRNGGGNRLTFEPAPFLVDALGKPGASSPKVRRPARGVAVRLRNDGYTVASKTGTRNDLIGIRSTTDGGRWKRFAHGTTRATEFGSETITVGPKATEDYLTVERRQGKRTLRWRIGSPGLEPRLSPDGGIQFVGVDQALSPVRIRPVTILDAHGKTITPAGLRWSVAHAGSGYVLELRLDDAKLPLPYVIDPAADYGPSVQYETKTQSTVLGGGSATEIGRASCRERV